jgi:hypothetical protein
MDGLGLGLALWCWTGLSLVSQLERSTRWQAKFTLHLHRGQQTAVLEGYFQELMNEIFGF